LILRHGIDGTPDILDKILCQTTESLPYFHGLEVKEKVFKVRSVNLHPHNINQRMAMDWMTDNLKSHPTQNPLVLHCEAPDYLGFLGANETVFNGVEASRFLVTEKSPGFQRQAFFGLNFDFGTSQRRMSIRRKPSQFLKSESLGSTQRHEHANGHVIDEHYPPFIGKWLSQNLTQVQTPICTSFHLCLLADVSALLYFGALGRIPSAF
jgi:hypothetical protein